MAMSDEHKAALAQGRTESRAIKRYLEALGARRPGRPVTTVGIQQRIDRLEERIAAESDSLKKVELRQQRLDAEDQLKVVGDAADFEKIEREFVRHVKPYSDRKGISYSAWRESGVSAEVLRAAGVPRTRRS